MKGSARVINAQRLILIVVSARAQGALTHTRSTAQCYGNKLELLTSVNGFFFLFVEMLQWNTIMSAFPIK